MLRCLTEKRDQIKAEACQAEVMYFMKMEVRMWRGWGRCDVMEQSTLIECMASLSICHSLGPIHSFTSGE